MSVSLVGPQRPDRLSAIILDVFMRVILEAVYILRVFTLKLLGIG